jgi:hypothetical protein
VGYFQHGEWNLFPYGIRADLFENILALAVCRNKTFGIIHEDELTDDELQQIGKNFISFQERGLAPKMPYLIQAETLLQILYLAKDGLKRARAKYKD